ncbi:MAG: acetylglutamate kinase [Alphaproteobacteria bacterium RIFCSPLOWO2_01_FULL_40_26]|nr:MAG: acetylglutamate kinase [Alphaproteobacteria bacterium RIFCSPHIGHO2_02_FULL_40_34]OFW95219.1 MAG: acetylglutamate kinase [Alphaproteobacteria bacterium RIFCSPLOWO2_01_FULL_40_26]OFX10017.1 MAG: acetylglutamate kinase [Alphaproteobacteria bacterium RIFCSPLOWO2_02_FULL_40_19]OFX12361.1 MAG: acetylglutamate kinase [Alphaproteobacteria bacterium RIFCSPLOWO2_12_FULL_40_11]
MQKEKSRQEWSRKAEILCEALPYMRKFAGETFVIKFGGSAMGGDTNLKNFAKNVVLLKQVGINPIVVHGGGPQIGQMLAKLNIKSNFVDGLRVTDADTVEVVEMVLAGSINKMIVKEINNAGGCAIGICGKDGNLIRAKKVAKTKKDPDSNIEKILNLGFVGEPYRVDPELLTVFEDSDIIPVIAPIGIGDGGETYNINADTAAGAIASALQASKLIILSDVDGVMLPNGELVSHLNIATARQMIYDGVITGGMIPKIETCINALESNVSYAHILNGAIDNIMLMEIFTESGAGTMIL